MVWVCVAKRRWWLGEEMYGAWSRGPQTKRKTRKPFVYCTLSIAGLPTISEPISHHPSTAIQHIWALHPAVIYIESMDATVLVEYLPITATIFTTRCYARVVYAIVICPIHPSVCPSQASLVSKWLDKSSWFWHKGFLPPISPTVYYKEIWVPPKIGVLPSGALSGTLDLKNSATASPSHCRLNSLTVKQVDDTYMIVDESQLFTTHQSAVTL